MKGVICLISPTPHYSSCVSLKMRGNKDSVTVGRIREK